MDVGAALREARERKGISLDELSRRTKISSTILRAIEASEFDKLPGGIFLRGFLRTYAGEVGLDPEETVARYLAQSDDYAIMEKSERADRPETPEAADVIGADEGRDGLPFFRLAFIVLILAAAGVFVFRNWTPDALNRPLAVSLEWWNSMRAAVRSEHPLPSTASAATTSGATGSTGTSAPVAAVESQPPVPPATPPAAAPATPEDGLIRVDIDPVAPCWVSATADGRRVTYRVINTGDRQRIEARSEIVLRVGEPTSFRYTINDKPGRSFGRAGEPASIRITPENYREYLTP